MGRIGYDSQYIPVEWLAAYGFEPERRIPRSLGAGGTVLRTLSEHSGVCSYAAALISEAAGGGELTALVVATVCDQMRRAAEFAARRLALPLFIFNMPKTWQGPAAARLYSSELLRLGRFLEELGGVPPDERGLRETLLRFEEARSCAPAAAAPPGFRRAAVVGAPLAGDQKYLVDELPLAVVLDATEAGELGQPGKYDRRALAQDPFAELCAVYFGLPHPARRPNHGFYAWLRERLVQREVQGLILTQHVWCDVWRAEAPRIKALLALPAVEVDFSGSGSALQRAKTRLQSLVEIMA